MTDQPIIDVCGELSDEAVEALAALLIEVSEGENTHHPEDESTSA